MMNPMQNGQQNPYQSQMHQMSQQRMMGMNNMNNMSNMSNMNNMQHMNYQMGMNNMSNMSNMNNMNQMQQMMMMQQQRNQRRYNYQNSQMQQNMRNNLQNMSMNMNANRANHNQQSNNQQNNTGSNQQNSSGGGSSSNNNNANKGPTKDTWISPFKNRDQNIDFFMYAYKCQPCPLRRNCQSKVTCPGWHHEGEKRRNPGEDPNFLYSEEPCPNVKPQGSNKWQPPSRCTDGDECGYSHTLLEQMYHPNIYKTSMCINFTNPQGNKCQWGFYCTHAHGQEDIRNPNKKQSASNDKVNAEDSNKNSSSNDKTTADASTSNKASTNTPNTSAKPMTSSSQTQPAAVMTMEGKRARSQSDAPNMYNAGHLRSPPYDTMMNQSHGSRSHMMPQYNSYASYNGQPHSSSLASNTSPTRVRGADFSPLPYQANHAKSYATNPPHFQLTETNPMYSHHTHTNYHDQSYLSYHQTQKRSRSISADTGLVPHIPTTKPSQQANIPQMYSRYHAHSHDPMPYAPHHHPSAQPTSDIPDDLPPPPMHPHPVMDASRVSRTYHKAQAQKATNVNNKSTPPPLTGKQAKRSSHNFLNGDINFYDPSMLQPREKRSMSAVGGGHDARRNPYLPNPAVIQSKVTKMGELQASSSLPSYAPANKVPPLPGQESANYFVKPPSDIPPQSGRPRSRSEPSCLPPLPNGQYNMVSDSIWRTNPNQEPGTASSNPNKSEVQRGGSHSQKLLSSDPFSSQKRLTSIPDVPDNDVTGANPVISPNALNIDNIVTPRYMISPDGQVTQQQNEADWNYFGFNKEDVQGVMSPVPDPKDIKKKIDVPPTPTPPPETMAMETKTKSTTTMKKRIGTKIKIKTTPKPTTTKEEDQIRRLQNELELAKKQMQILTTQRNALLPTVDSSKKSVTLNTVKPNDDEKESETKSSDGKQQLTEIQKQQLLRYKHFITCPSCKQFAPNISRNQVLIPCGHLICGQCSSQTQENRKCPLCQDDIKNYQVLLIE